jgi:hypothetical protein
LALELGIAAKERGAVMAIQKKSLKRNSNENKKAKSPAMRASNAKAVRANKEVSLKHIEQLPAVQ